MDRTIHPIDDLTEQHAAHLTIDSYYKADDGSEWLRMGDRYEKIVEPWVVADHIPPTKDAVSLGDVASWCAFVERFKSEPLPLLTWSEQGLLAVLDYGAAGEPGRGQWTASHPFETSGQWDNWTAFANGKTSWTQKGAVDKLDEYADDVVEPASATLLDIIRTMRATVSSRAESEYRQDGGMLLSYTQDSKLVGKAAVPSEITIQIPVLKGHTLDDGRTPVMYRLPVKIRPSVDPKDGTVSFRFLMPTKDRILEAVYADRVAAAKALLGDEIGKTLYRATA